VKQILLILALGVGSKALAQLTADAGPDKMRCPGQTITIGGFPSATGGNPPYTYHWEPATGLSADNIANPIASADAWINYTLTVTDKDGTQASDVASIYVNDIYYFNAGIDTGYCFGQQNGPRIGASANTNTNHNFSWQPPTGLDDPSSPNPIATPTVPTTYTLTISTAVSGQCPNKISLVTVYPWIPPVVDAGPDSVVIDEGQTYTLHGLGGTMFWWSPLYNIKYEYTPQPDIWPTVTTTYTLGSQDQHKCYGYDTIRVVVRKGDLLFFYNTFTPNNDGNNDKFYIGNVEKYPDNVLKIYNRYGKVVFSANSYDNTWDGLYLGSEVPTGTYFYIFDDGKGQTYKGTVSILR